MQVLTDDPRTARLCTEYWAQNDEGEWVYKVKALAAEHDLPFAAGPKTVTTLQDLLETFSIGQVYSFIWRAARDSIAYFVREGVPRQQAANSAIGRIQRSADNARANRWDVKGFRRTPKLPISMLSHLFFTVTMKVPDLMTAQLSEAQPPRSTYSGPGPGKH